MMQLVLFCDICCLICWFIDLWFARPSLSHWVIIISSSTFISSKSIMLYHVTSAQFTNFQQFIDEWYFQMPSLPSSRYKRNFPIESLSIFLFFIVCHWIIQGQTMTKDNLLGKFGKITVCAFQKSFSWVVRVFVKMNDKISAFRLARLAMSLELNRRFLVHLSTHSRFSGVLSFVLLSLSISWLVLSFLSSDHPLGSDSIGKFRLYRDEGNFNFNFSFNFNLKFLNPQMELNSWLFTKSMRSDRVLWFKIIDSPRQLFGGAIKIVWIPAGLAVISWK
jgi:hypothetical protein